MSFRIFRIDEMNVVGRDNLDIVFTCQFQNRLVCRNLVHCGWRGSVADILGAAVAQMCALGAHPADIRAAIGPGIGACCFEVGPEVVAAAEALLHEPLGALVRPRADGKALLNLKGVNARRLAQLGVPAGQIAVSDACTMCRPDVFWSHRATDGRRGVQAAVITL